MMIDLGICLVGGKARGRRGGCGAKEGEEYKLDTAAEEAVPTMAAEPQWRTDQDVKDMTPDQVQAAVARGSLKTPQMPRLFGGAALSNKKLPR